MSTVSSSKPLPAPRKATKLSRQLVTHRDVASAFGVSVCTLVRWIKKGEFPRPHSTIGAFMFYDVNMIEHRLKTGLWPSGTKFHGVRHLLSDPDETPGAD